MKRTTGGQRLMAKCLRLRNARPRPCPWFRTAFPRELPANASWRQFGTGISTSLPIPNTKHPSKHALGASSQHSTRPPKVHRSSRCRRETCHTLPGRTRIYSALTLFKFTPNRVRVELTQMTIALTRLPHLSREDFQSYWFEHHAPLVRQCADVLGILEYHQLHAVAEM